MARTADHAVKSRSQAAIPPLQPHPGVESGEGRREEKAGSAHARIFQVHGGLQN